MTTFVFSRTLTTLPRLEPSRRPSVCRKSCCWTPFGHSAVAAKCTCHEGDD